MKKLLAVMAIVAVAILNAVPVRALEPIQIEFLDAIVEYMNNDLANFSQTTDGVFKSAKCTRTDNNLMVTMHFSDAYDFNGLSEADKTSLAQMMGESFLEGFHEDESMKDAVRLLKDCKTSFIIKVIDRYNNVVTKTIPPSAL